MDFRVAPSRRTEVAGLTPVGRRGHYRHQVQSLAYVNLDQSNGGIIRNLGDSGLAIQAVAPLHVNQQVFLRFELVNPRVRVEATGRVAWADPVGQAGVEFLTLSQRSERLLKDWIFIQFLASAQHSAEDSTLLYGKSGQEVADELLFSSGKRPAIRLKPRATAARLGETRNPSRVLHLPWFPFAISAPALSLLVDGLILLSAVLLFALICMAMVGVVPAWPLALVMGIGVAAVFGVLYRFLFLFWMGSTPGDWIAGLSGDACRGNETPADDRPRFR
jgi:Tfp pilus assembly protein PilZ